MVTNIWILKREPGFWVVIETKDMLFYLSSKEKDPAGIALEGEYKGFWISMSKDSSLYFESKRQAEDYLSQTCGYSGSIKTDFPGWRLPLTAIM